MMRLFLHKFEMNIIKNLEKSHVKISTYLALLFFVLFISRLVHAVDESYFRKELENLRFINTRAYSRVAQIESESDEFEVKTKISEAENLRNLKNSLVKCDEKCFAKILKAKESPIGLSFDGLELSSENIYADSELKSLLGNIVMTNKAFFVLENEVFFLKNINEDYSNAHELLNIDPIFFDIYSILPPMIPYQGKGRLGGAIWLPWLKRFGYYPKHTNFFVQVNDEFSRNEQSCFTDNFKRGFRGQAKLLDETGRIVESSMVETAIVAGYKSDGEMIDFYILNEGGKKYSNEVDGFLIDPNFLLKYYVEKQFYTYSTKREDLIDENGNLVFYQIYDRENQIKVRCPTGEVPKEFEEVKNGNLKFSDLDKYIYPTKVPNILFDCSSLIERCK